MLHLLGRESDPAIADCRYRVPLVPHLARPQSLNGYFLAERLGWLTFSFASGSLSRSSITCYLAERVGLTPLRVAIPRHFRSMHIESKQ